MSVEKKRDSADREKLIHHFAAMTGGFFGGYTVVNHCDILGNAQTANMIKMIKELFCGSFAVLPFLLLCFFVYVAGNVFSAVSQRLIPADPRAVSMAVTAAAIVAIGLSPAVSNDYLALMPIFFAAPVQWNAFVNAAGYSSSTIFSSNNLRIATTSLTTYIMTKDEAERDRAKFYWATLLFFHLGVALSCVVSLFLSTAGIWFAFIPLTLTAVAYAGSKSMDN